jgi:hypothetical protein
MMRRPWLIRQSGAMADYDDPTTAQQRLSNSDRESAVSSLAKALADGRISTEEFTERSASAKSAVTRGDLAPLFADLPGAAEPAAGIPTPPPAAVAPVAAAPSGGYGRRQPLGGRAGIVVVSLTPFVALALFFIFGYAVGGWSWSWIFFLLIPLSGIIVYGAGGRRDDYR